VNGGVFLSQFHYIASPIKLECGSFGSQKVDIIDIKIISPYLLLVNFTVEVKLEFPIDKNKGIEQIKKELFIYDNQEDAGGIYIDSLTEGKTIIENILIMNSYIL
jgi:hypothetical protein